MPEPKRHPMTAADDRRVLEWVSKGNSAGSAAKACFDPPLNPKSVRILVARMRAAGIKTVEEYDRAVSEGCPFRINSARPRRPQLHFRPAATPRGQSGPDPASAPAEVKRLEPRSDDLTPERKHELGVRAAALADKPIPDPHALAEMVAEWKRARGLPPDAPTCEPPPAPDYQDGWSTLPGGRRHGGRLPRMAG